MSGFETIENTNEIQCGHCQMSFSEDSQCRAINGVRYCSLECFNVGMGILCERIEQQKPCYFCNKAAFDNSQPPQVGKVREYCNRECFMKDMNAQFGVNF